MIGYYDNNKVLYNQQNHCPCSDLGEFPLKLKVKMIAGL
jgi:hypothetical protein